MSTTWLETLTASGASFTDNSVTDFGRPEAERAAAETGAILAPLDEGLLCFEGADAARLLHGQLSNDIENLGEQRCVLAGFASPQGRLRAIVRVFRHGGAYWLQLPAGLVEAVHAEFRKFAPLYRQLTLRVATGELALLGVSGVAAEAALSSRFAPLPAEVGQGVTRDGLSLYRLPGRVPRFELMGAPESLAACWPALCQALTPAGRPAWELTEIAAGLPQIYTETADSLLPLHANLQLVGGIHWKKGCYTGQEIIARMYYRATLKRHTYHAQVATTENPAPGTPLYAGTELAGTVLRAAPGTAGQMHLLAELASAAAVPGSVRLGSENGPILEFVELPYALVASYQSGTT